MILKGAIVLCMVIGAAVAVDYCKNMKCGRKPHVACRSPAANGRWAPSCSSDHKGVNITPELKNRLLEIHNKQRQQQAAGETPNYEPAARMGTLVWDDGLAEMAGYNVRLCKYAHDPCRNTEKYFFVGQNIAKGTGAYDDKEIIELAKIWFDDENQNGYISGWMDLINSYVGSPDERVETGHFTQVVWEDAAVIGCAASRYTDAKGKQSVLVCNYGFGNLENKYVYEAGEPGSKCTTGTNPDYPALCSVNEDYTESILSRTGWDLKPITRPDGSFSLPIPWGCDDDPECRKMKANPSAYMAKFNNNSPQQSTNNFNQPQPKPDGSGVTTLQLPPGCDSACANKIVQDFIASHPGYTFGK